jgi:hypothetical protein
MQVYANGEIDSANVNQVTQTPGSNSTLPYLPIEIRNRILLHSAKTQDSKHLLNILNVRKDILLLVLKSNDEQIYDKFPATLAMLMSSDSHVNTTSVILQYPRLVNWGNETSNRDAHGHLHVMNPFQFATVCQRLFNPIKTKESPFNATEGAPKSTILLNNYIKRHLNESLTIISHHGEFVQYRVIINYWLQSMLLYRQIPQLTEALVNKDVQKSMYSYIYIHLVKYAIGVGDRDIFKSLLDMLERYGVNHSDKRSMGLSIANMFHISIMRVMDHSDGGHSLIEYRSKLESLLCLLLDRSVSAEEVFSNGLGSQLKELVVKFAKQVKDSNLMAKLENHYNHFYNK